MILMFQIYFRMCMVIYGWQYIDRFRRENLNWNILKKKKKKKKKKEIFGHVSVATPSYFRINWWKKKKERLQNPLSKISRSIYGRGMVLTIDYGTLLLFGFIKSFSLSKVF